MRHKSFTLVEILAVVVLLGILASVVIPQFAYSTAEAREAALRSDLNTVRAQIQLYELQHDMYPGHRRRRNGRLSKWGEKRFIQQLLGTSDVDGNQRGTDYGPYLQKFPANSFTKKASKAAKIRKGQPNGKGKGWAFDPKTGKFHANDADTEHQAW